MEDLRYQIDLLTAMNEKLMNSEHIYRLCSEFSGSYFIYYNLKNEKHTELIGNWDDLVGSKISKHPYDENYMLSLVAEENQKLVRDNIIDIEKRSERFSECVFQSKSKKSFFKANVKVNYDAHGIPFEKIVCISDITKQKNDTEEIEYFAFHDTLTGLYSRNYFITKLRDFCDRADKEKNTVEFMLIDIDNFKRINDSLGLVLGDELVQDFGLYLKDFSNENVLVGRFGSDVFSIAIYNPCGSRSCDMIFKNIKHRLRKPFILTNQSEVSFSVSAGVTEYPGGGNNAFELVKNAEIVLYVAKEKNKGSISYFDESMLDRFIKNVNLEERLKEAIENQDFEMYYQPLFSSENGAIRGAEALIRWPDKKGGFVANPDSFIPMAEKNGSIISIGNFVFNEVFKYMQELKLKYKIDFTFSINISAIQLMKDNFLDELQKYMELYDINPENVELEITETVLINNFYDSIDKLTTLRRLGVKISLDDFGTGFSALSYLRELPISTLKIDKSFIDHINTDDKTTIIVGNTIDLVKKLQLESVAEGVEDKAQFDYLKEQGCDNIQGYLLSKPISKADFEKLIIRQLP